MVRGLGGAVRGLRRRRGGGGRLLMCGGARVLEVAVPAAAAAQWEEERNGGACQTGMGPDVCRSRRPALECEEMWRFSEVDVVET